MSLPKPTENSNDFSEVPLNANPLRSNSPPRVEIYNNDHSDDEEERPRGPMSQRPRPSFTIGSDSDSVSASVDSIPLNFQFPDQSNLKPIVSGAEIGTSGFLDSGGFKPGYMGGMRSRASSVSSQFNQYNKSNGDGYDDEDMEIHLIAKEGTTPWLSRRQWLTFIVFGFVEFISAMVISLQAPFYPAEAEKKGATASEYGFVFGVFELTVFLISPIYGANMNKIGPKLVFNLGIVTTATCAILFGFLDKIEDRTTFTSLSILVRIIEALGEAGFITASFVIIAAEFNSVATTFASMETLYGFGLIAGPLAGGFLYQVGGYTLPFVTVGGLLLVAALGTHFVLPKTRTIKELSNKDASSSGFQILKVLRVPSIALAAFSIFSASTSVGYLNATLEPHIRQFNLTPLTTGSIFIINGGAYAISAPAWGWLCDKTTQLKYVTLIGELLIICGFGLIGPIPYIPLDTALWAVIVGQVIQGIGLGAVLVSGFLQALRDAMKAGFSDDIHTYGLISGMWTSMFALGSFVGPTISGVLFDYVGFRVGTLFVLALQVIVMVLVVVFLCSNGSNESKILEEMDPLLPSTSKPIDDEKPGTSRMSSSRGRGTNPRSENYGTL